MTKDQEVTSLLILERDNFKKRTKGNDDETAKQVALHRRNRRERSQNLTKFKTVLASDCSFEGILFY